MTNEMNLCFQSRRTNYWNIRAHCLLILRFADLLNRVFIFNPYNTVAVHPSVHQTPVGDDVPATTGALRPGLPRPGGLYQRAEICDEEEEGSQR